MQKICVNGKFYIEQEPVIKASDKSYRYGDGFFETIKVLNNKILLSNYHQKRIEKTILLLGYKMPVHYKTEHIFNRIIELCKINGCQNAARVRLSFSNGNGGLFDESDFLHYIIESWPLDPGAQNFNENGLVTDIFPLAKKSCDKISNIKSASALLYSIAAKYCKQQQLNDCIILNQRENICESSIANVFWIKDNRIFTPALTEGCVDGIMRAYLIDQIDSITETPCRQNDLLEADEVFITNAIRGIRWIKSIDDKTYSNSNISKLYKDYIQPLFNGQ